MAEEPKAVDNVGFPIDGNPQQHLSGENFTAQGETKTVDVDVALVVQSATLAQNFIQNRQWTLLWRDADLLFQAPRPMTVYENTYILEPNVQRFTLATIVNAVVPQLYKGLFYDDPPMVLRPRPGTSQTVTDAKTALFSYLFDQCNFKRNTKWGLETMAHQGTGIFKWGIEWKEIQICKRVPAQDVTQIDRSDGKQDALRLPTEEPPKLSYATETIPIPFFEHRPLDKVLVDPKTQVGDIQRADYVVDIQYMDFYQITELKTNIENCDDDEEKENWAGLLSCKEEELKTIWSKAPQPNEVLNTTQSTYITGVVHHAEYENQKTSPDPLRQKLEVLEYWDKKRKIVVINRSHCLCKAENKFKVIPFLSANWWNRPKAFYGMGLGLIIGQNQRVDQGTINAILKILSYGVNPIYLRSRGTNAPTQMIRTGLGRILAVDVDPQFLDKAYHLLDTPTPPTGIWDALAESQRATESSSGADQLLVQGSSMGPRSSITRTSGGANLMAGASATRLDGPLDNFIEQVFKPFLYILDMLILHYMSDRAILTVLGQELGQAFLKDLNMQEFWESKFEFEVLAGASLAAKRTMAQSMLLITQIFSNPQIQESLADINEEYIDFKPILRMWMESSEWKNVSDIIKPMTDEMKKKRAANSKAALMQQQTAAKQQSDQQKFAQKQELEDQSSDNRIKRDMVRESARANSMSEAVEGEPGTKGIEGQMPTVM